MKKILKIFSILLLLFLLFTLSITFSVSASFDDYVYLGGDSIGIKMQTGVYIVGKYQVSTNDGKKAPWQKASLEIGDEIIALNGIKIVSNKDLLNYLNDTNLENVKITIKRGNKELITSCEVVKNKNNEPSLGLYIRDQILGIGTLTFINKDGIYGSLGHGVYENKVLVNNKEGSLYYSSVSSIKKAENGTAGEKRANIGDVKIGSIISNDLSGLYGKFNQTYTNRTKVVPSKNEEITRGPAKIYTALSSNVIKGYDIEITDLNYQTSKSTKGIKFKVVDEELINMTGGIVQGMSGSPIVQNGKIVGAVSHVMVENPTNGYGMYIKWMLDEAKNLA